jgi:hypothetical protein
MTPRAQQYVQKANEFERRALAASDEETRRLFAEIARQWRELAEDPAHLKRMQDQADDGTDAKLP